MQSYLGVMSINNNQLELYEDVKDFLRYITGSAARAKILISLNEGPHTLNDLRNKTGMNTSTLSNTLTNLERKKIIHKKENKYFLSSTGDMMVFKLMDTMETFDTVIKFKKLWLDHDTESIPPSLKLEIGKLSKSFLIESEPGEIYKTHENFQNMLTESKYIKGFSPIYRSAYSELFRTIIESGVSVELILTPEILNKTLKEIDSESFEFLKHFMSEDKVKLWVIDDEIKIAFTVTDKHLSLGLFHQNGSYDNSRDLISDDHAAIAWGNKLFEYYRSQAERYKP